MRLRRDQRLTLGRLRARHGHFGGGYRTLFPGSDERRFQRGDVVGKSLASGSQGVERITFSAICGASKCFCPHAFWAICSVEQPFSHPALLGLQVS